jgi:hypothetical protein
MAIHQCENPLLQHQETIANLGVGLGVEIVCILFDTQRLRRTAGRSSTICPIDKNPIQHHTHHFFPYQPPSLSRYTTSCSSSKVARATQGRFIVQPSRRPLSRETLPHEFYSISRSSPWRRLLFPPLASSSAHN